MAVFVCVCLQESETMTITFKNKNFEIPKTRNPKLFLRDWQTHFVHVCVCVYLLVYTPNKE